VGKEEEQSSGERVAFHWEVRRVVNLLVAEMGLGFSSHRRGKEKRSLR